MISQSKFSGTRKFTLRYQLFGMIFNFEISRVDCIRIECTSLLSSDALTCAESMREKKAMDEHFSHSHIFLNMVFIKILSNCSCQNTLNCLNNGTPKSINFPFVPNGKLKFSGDPMFKYVEVIMTLTRMK